MKRWNHPSSVSTHRLGDLIPRRLQQELRDMVRRSQYVHGTVKTVPNKPH